VSFCCKLLTILPFEIIGVVMTGDPLPFPDFDPDQDEVIARDLVTHAIPATDRSQARRFALQALYEIDSAHHSIGEVLAHIVPPPGEESRKVRSYIRDLVQGVLSHQEQIDVVLQTYAPEWPLNQVAVIDRNILRIALYELVIGRGIPVGVAIDEAVELAKLFGAEGTARFVNGVLGTIAANIEELHEQFSETYEEIQEDPQVDAIDSEYPDPGLREWENEPETNSPGSAE